QRAFPAEPPARMSRTMPHPPMYDVKGSTSDIRDQVLRGDNRQRKQLVGTNQWYLAAAAKYQCWLRTQATLMASGLAVLEHDSIDGQEIAEAWDVEDICELKLDSRSGRVQNFQNHSSNTMRSNIPCISR